MLLLSYYFPFPFLSLSMREVLDLSPEMFKLVNARAWVWSIKMDAWEIGLVFRAKRENQR